MSAKALQALLTGKTADVDKIVGWIISHPDSLKEVLAGLGAEKPRTKYGCLKVLRRISEDQPGLLYPEFDRFVELMESENKILSWGAIQILGNLAVVDNLNKSETILGRYLEPLAGPLMITAANCIRGAGRIAAAQPALAGRIAQALVGVEKAVYQTAECRNVALGHTVESLDGFFGVIPEPAPVIAFVRRQTRNPRSAVSRKATRFLKRHAP
jgi:hypothetical protein